MSKGLFYPMQFTRDESIVWQALLDTAPVVLGVIPFGLTCGIMGLTVGLTALETILMSALVFAGAAQFTAILLLGSVSAGFTVVVFTTLVINLRHILMGASLASVTKNLPLLTKSFLVFSLTDEAFAITTAHMERNTYKATYQVVVSLSLYIAWILSTAIGVLFTSHISDPLAWGLDFAMPASFIVLLIQRLKTNTGIVVALVSGASSVVAALLLPGKLYIIAACILACTAGLIVERKG